MKDKFKMVQKLELRVQHTGRNENFHKTLLNILNKIKLNCKNIYLKNANTKNYTEQRVMSSQVQCRRF